MTQEDIDRLYARPERFKFLGVDVTQEQIYPQFIPNNGYPFSLKLYQIYGLLPAPRYYTRYHYDQDAVIALAHHPDHRLGPRRPDQDAADHTFRPT